MPRTCMAALFAWLAAASSLIAAEPPRSDEHVHWRPQRDVKPAIEAQLREFEQSLRDKLGPAGLALRPYGDEQPGPAGKTVDAVTVDQIVTAMIESLRARADRENRDFLPIFSAYRRTSTAGGGDLRSAPVMGPPDCGQLSGNLTFRIEWEASRGRFVHPPAQDAVDEVYQVELDATLTLGIDLRIQRGQRLTVISHAITKPIVADWQVSLAASQGEVQPILNSGPQRDTPAGR